MTVHHIYPYRSFHRDTLRQQLAEAGIGTLCHYPVPIHRQPCFASRFQGEDYPMAETLAAEELSLPLSPAMTEAEAERVAAAVKAAEAGQAIPQGDPVSYSDISRLTASYGTTLEEAACRVIRSGWYVQGSECRAFEQEFANYCAGKAGLWQLHCVGCANGLDALTLLLIALKQRNGWTAQSEVIVPALTFIATAQAVLRAGLTLRLCDITPDGLMDPMSAATAITPQTVALLPVHLYGRRADLDELSQLADIHGLALVQDAAQGHGLPLDVKSGGLQAAFSFYPGKNLGALGDGGAMVTDDGELAAHVRQLANYGAKEKYCHEMPEAFNSRLDELQAALLRVKLTRLDEDNARRSRIAAIYDKALARI